MASSSKDIKNALISYIQEQQKDGEPAFVTVTDSMTKTFTGYPSVAVLPASQSSSKAAYGQNDRTVAFIVRTYLPVEQDGSEVDYMYDLTDLLINALDEADFTNALDVQTYLLNASRGDWYDTDTEAGPVIMADINVEVTYSKDL